MLRFIYLCYLRNHASLFTKIREEKYTNRSVIPAKFSTSALMMANLDLGKCCEFIKELTLEVGKILKCNFEKEKEVQTKETEWNFVTNFDLEIEKMLIDGITKQFPDHKIIAEESVAQTKEMPVLTDAPTWLIDPIDGTVNFIHAFPQICICVGLTICKEPVLGIIYNPLNSELYSAIRGEGAFLNGKRICTSATTELRKAMQVLEPTAMKNSSNKDIYISRFLTLLDAARATRSIGSAGLTMAYIAKGVIDCFHLDNLKAWDIVAATVILREAGGTVLDTKGGVYNIMKPNTVAASNETLAREMVKLIIDTDLKTQRKRLKRT